VDVARQHFAKEETILFPMAEQVLSLAELEELGAQFDARRRVVMI
jgi:hemerythrin-like domain-containing protein